MYNFFPDQLRYNSSTPVVFLGFFSKGTRLEKYLLFDMDGVVVETEHLKAAAHTAAIEYHGGQVPAELYPTVMGQTHTRVRAAFIQACGVAIQAEEYTRVYREVYQNLLAAGPRLVPGVSELLRSLHAAGCRLGLVTSSAVHSAQLVLDWLEQTGFLSEGLFSARIFGEDVAHGKPAADPYLLGLQRLGADVCAPGQCRGLAFEDSHAGLESARAAGLPVIALRHRYNAQQDFSAAAAVLTSFEDTPAVFALIEQCYAEIKNG
jgi:HAD superfamily hydrolase (TIGR01509 family)